MEGSETREPSYYEIALTNRQVLVAFVLLLTCMVVAFFSGVWIGRGSGGGRSGGVTVAGPAVPGEAPVAEFKFFSEGTQQGQKQLPTPAPVPAATGPRAGAAPATRGAGAPAASAAPATTAGDRRGERTLAEELEAGRGQGTGGTVAAGEAEEATPDGAAPLRPAPATATAPPKPAKPDPGSSAPKPATARPTGTPAEPAASKPAPSQTTPAAAAASPAPKPSTAATPAPTASAPAATAAAPGALFIQVFSSPDGAQAQRIYDKLRKAGYRVAVAQMPKGGQTLHRVRVGPFDSRTDAQAKAERIRKDFRLETWVTNTP